MRKLLLALTLTVAGVSLSACWHDGFRGPGDHGGGHHGDHGGDHGDHGQ
jgi:hypothetical protein